ncbi:MAG: GNAT family N-acetyltransferase [Synergistaceae bacterium]|jgi:GNAT superfamily N-acetyltransferase|nr:GNAT family N-acetyltransferase [Synergistaceae bacterium]
MGNVVIRDFERGDLDGYIEMSESFFSSCAVLHPVPHEHITRTFEECLRKNPLLRGLILEIEKVVAGYALLSFTWSNEAGGPCVLIEEVYVIPGFRGEGAGSALLRFVEGEYGDKASRFRLEVTRTNDSAIRLYERRGYERLDYLQMVKDCNTNSRSTGCF